MNTDNKAMAAYFQSIGYEPHKEQWSFHNSDARFRVATCGRRFGKSTMAARDVVPKHILQPEQMIWLVGPTYLLAEKEFRVIWNDLIIKKKFGRDKRIKKSYNVRCVDEETEILTQRGWLKFNEVEPGDETLTVNPATGLSEWQTIGEVSRYSGTHDVVSMSNSTFSAKVTHNHRWLTQNNHSLKWRWKITDTLTRNDRIPRAAPCVNLPTEPKYTDAFVELVAWLWTEGHWTNDGYLRISQSLTKNLENVERIRRALTELCPEPIAMQNQNSAASTYWSEAERPVPNGTRAARFNIGAELSRVFLKVFSAPKIVRPEFVRSLTTAQLRLFVDVSVLGDGTDCTKKTATTTNIGQENEEQLFAVQLACSLLGIATSTMKYDAWRLNIQKDKWAMPWYSEWTEEKYVGTVWCPTVRNSNWLARREGKVYFTGNTGDMHIYFPWGTRVEARSAEHPDLLVGEGLDHVIMCEAAKHKKETWDRFIRPSLADRRGSADFPTTPEGFNFLYDLWRFGRDPSIPEYESWRFPSWSNTTVYPGGRQDAEIILLERTMDTEWFNQEIAADFASFVGKIFPDWDEFVHVRPHTFRPEWKNYIAFDWGYCVDEQTEILTQSGWKNHRDLSEGDMVLTQNPQHGFSEWQPVESVHTFQGTFDMRKMSHGQHSSFSTSNHRWLVCDGSGKNYKFKTTDELTSADVITSAAPCLNLPTEPKYSDAFVELVAWYWTEGEHNGALPERVYQNKSDGVYRIVKCLTELCGPARDSLRNLKEAAWRQDIHGTGGQVFRFNRYVGAQLEQVCPGRTKAVTPEFICSLTESQLQLFVNASLAGDGWTTNGGSRCIGQNGEDGKKRLDTFQIALHLLGIATTCKLQSNGQWRLTLLTMSHLHPKSKPATAVAYTGTVWCPKTSNGTWLARRNNTVYFTGNTNPLAAVEFQVSPDDRIFVWRVYYKSYKTVPDVAAELAAQEQPDGYHIDLCFGDPADPEAVEMMTRELNKQFQTILNGRGIAVWAPKSLKSDYTWLDGIMLMRQFMKCDREVPHDEWGTPTLEPSFFVDPACADMIKEFSNYRSKEAIKGRNVPEMGNKIEDHTIDAIRYALLCIFKIGCQYSLADVMSVGQNATTSIPSGVTGFQRETALVTAGAPNVFDGDYFGSGASGIFGYDTEF